MAHAGRKVMIATMDTKRNQVLSKLLRDTAAGDSLAFQRLYDETSPFLYALAVKTMRAQSSADDVLQDAFVQIWHRAADYHSERGNVLAWLSAIVRYRAIDALRKQRNDAPLDGAWQSASEDINAVDTSDDGDDGPRGPAGPLSSAMAADDSRFLKRCLSRLSESQKQSVALAFFHGMTHQELSASLALPLGTIKSRLRRGLQRLKECLGEIGYSNEIYPPTS